MPAALPGCASRLRYVRPNRSRRPRSRCASSRNMETAFAGAFLLPPPPARPGIVAWRDRTGARRAADRRIARVVQRVVRDSLGVDVRPDVVAAPVGKRHSLPDEPVLEVHAELWHRPPIRRLIAPQAGDPAVGG